MQLATIWQQLQRVHQELKAGSVETQDTAIAALQDLLDESSALLFPSFVYPLLTDVLDFYCRKILPSLCLSGEDQRMVHSGFEQTICRLNTQAQITKNLETQLKQVFLQVKSGTFDSVEEIIGAFRDLTPRSPFPCREGGART